MACEYARRHRKIWPELGALLRDSGVREYTIYLDGQTAFSHMEVENYVQLVRRVSASAVAERWERLFADLLEYPHVDPSTGWPPPLLRLWSL
jgi:L-rhamnose mutarotase